LIVTDETRRVAPGLGRFLTLTSWYGAQFQRFLKLITGGRHLILTLTDGHLVSRWGRMSYCQLTVTPTGQRVIGCSDRQIS
jgi:hypothetical protein